MTSQNPPTHRRDELGDFTVTALCVVMIALGTLWRFQSLDYPPSFTFDEHHFVLNARNYINHQADWNDHPPLGKLLLIPAMQLVGDTGTGWRLSSAFLGTLLFCLAGWNASRLFQDRRVGLLTAAFVSLDGLFISYSRSALIDTPLVAFMYGALAVVLWRSSLPYFFAAAVFIGLAVATKWTGICVFLLMPWILWRARHSPAHAAWMFGVAALVYIGVSAVALAITQQPMTLTGMLRANWSLLQHHAGFTVWDNPVNSRWYTWPFLIQPILMYYEEPFPGAVRALSMLGNLVLWFSTTLAVGFGLFRLGKVGLRWLRTRAPLALVEYGMTFSLLGMVALMLPFILSNRQSYIFHYLPVYGLGLGLLAWTLSTWLRQKPWGLAGFLTFALVVGIFYSPLWTLEMQTRAAFEARLIFPGWR